MDDNSLLLEKDISTLRRSTNILIVILITFCLFLTIIIAASMMYLLNSSIILDKPDPPIPLNPAVQAFYSAAACNTPSCIEIFDILIYNKSITDPNQILVLSLQTSAKVLELTISMLTDSIGDIRNETTIALIKNCSNSLRVGSSRIRDALVTVRANPFVERWSDEQRVETTKLINVAEEDLKPSCRDDLGKVELTRVSSEVIIARVHLVKVYLKGCGDFVGSYD